MTTTIVCAEPEYELAPVSDHRTISPLFFSQALFQVELSHFLPRSMVISIVSSVGNIGMLLVLLA